MTTTTETQYTIRFIGSYFSLLTTVMAENEEQAYANAIANLEDQHGLDMNNAGVCQIDVFDEDGEEL
jgi:hypothetical protein